MAGRDEGRSDPRRGLAESVERDRCAEVDAVDLELDRAGRRAGSWCRRGDGRRELDLLAVNEGFELLMRAVAVSARLTSCGPLLLVLVLKLVSPLYVATSALAPGSVDTSVHWPSATGAEQPDPPVTSTVPVGVPLPGLLTVTLHFTVYDSPVTVSLSSSTPLVMTVVVSAWLTV